VPPLVTPRAEHAASPTSFARSTPSRPGRDHGRARNARRDRDARRLLPGVDLALDGLSLASIYFLAAIGLAITFGVMGVINMAHGEFIMIGAYTGYVVQQFIPDYTMSIIVALPLAFT
jgi:urea transport system permease protein